MKRVNNLCSWILTGVLPGLLLPSAILLGETILAWEFSGGTGEEKTVEAVIRHEYLAGTDSSFLIRRGAGISHGPNNDRFNANFWAEPDLESALSNGDYFEWEVHPKNGCTVELSSMSMKIERSSTGPHLFHLRTNIDNWEEDLENWEITTTSTQITVDLSALPVRTDRIIFRLYGYGNSTNAGSAGFEGSGYDLIIEGTLKSRVSLPEKLRIKSANSTEMVLGLKNPRGEKGVDWDGYYIFGGVNAPNSLNIENFNGTEAIPDTHFPSSSIHEGSHCLTHITDESIRDVLITGLESGNTYYITAFSYLSDGADTVWSVMATEQTLRFYDIVINEVLADPATDISGDANNDGVRHASEDEFIEFYNNSGETADISGWMIGDADQIRHIFPENSLIPNDGIMVVFGGGLPNLPDSEAIINTSSSGTLSLNNTNESISLLTPDSTVITSYSWGSEGGQDQSMVRNPAVTGDFILHMNLSGTTPFSPGIISNDENSLPVSLSLINCERSDYMVRLVWHTESETENAGFIVTRQYEEEKPIELANYISDPGLRGAGTSTVRKTYHFTDYPVKPGMYTYWLTDFSYSGERTEHSHKKIRVPFNLDSKPYPNPFNTSFHIPLRLVKRENITFEIINLLGQTVLTIHQTFDPGDHDIPVNMTPYQSGIYFLKIIRNQEIAVTKLIYLK
jgi:hypothetical protein